MHKTNDISYQNKDIASKIFAEKFKGKSLHVYGIDLPPVKQVLPTNLPDIQANELRLDNLFLLEDNIILPLTYPGMEQKKDAIIELFELTKDIKEEDTQLFLLTGILVFTDKVIDEAIAKRIKEWIRMTKVAKLFEEEKEEAMKRVAEQTAIELLKDGVSIDKIAKYVKYLNVKEIEGLEEKLNGKE